VAMSISYGVKRFFGLLTKLYRIQLQRVTKDFTSLFANVKETRMLKSLERKALPSSNAFRSRRPVLKTAVTLKT
jgi:hypothetical protein